MNIRTTIFILALLALHGHSLPRAAAGDTDPDAGRMARLMAGAILVEEVDPESGAYRGIGLVRAPWERIWQGLTEEQFFTRIFEENRDGVLSEQGAGYDVYCFHPRFFLMTFDYCLRRGLDRRSRRITWRLTEGDFEELEGSWELEPADEGRSTLVTFTSRVKIGSWIPESWVRRSSRNRIPRTLLSLRLWGETGRFLPEE